MEFVGRVTGAGALHQDTSLEQGENFRQFLGQGFFVSLGASSELPPFLLEVLLEVNGFLGKLFFFCVVRWALVPIWESFRYDCVSLLEFQVLILCAAI